MTAANKLTLWIKAGDNGPTENSLRTCLLGRDDVQAVAITEVAGSALTRKEALLAVTLSVSANFATDGIKAVIAALREETKASVVMCRRQDGTEIDIGHLDDSSDTNPKPGPSSAR